MSTDIAEPLLADPDFLAFQALDGDFVARHAGQFVGFCGGRMVALAADKSELLRILAREHPEETCLVQELRTGGLRTVHFRRPRRMIRTGNQEPSEEPLSTQR